LLFVSCRRVGIDADPASVRRIVEAGYHHAASCARRVTRPRRPIRAKPRSGLIHNGYRGHAEDRVFAWTVRYSMKNPLTSLADWLWVANRLARIVSEPGSETDLPQQTIILRTRALGDDPADRQARSGRKPHALKFNRRPTRRCGNCRGAEVATQAQASERTPIEVRKIITPDFRAARKKHPSLASLWLSRIRDEFQVQRFSVSAMSAKGLTEAR
jgi:hypothetical protein